MTSLARTCLVLIFTLGACVTSHALTLERPRPHRRAKRYAYVTMAVDKRILDQHMLSVPDSESRNDPTKLQRIRDEATTSQVDQSNPAFNGKSKSMHDLYMTFESVRNSGSKYPIIALTNDDNYNSTDLAAMNVIPVRLHEGNYLTPPSCKMTQEYRGTYQKLNIFGLTDYEKLIWLDSDSKMLENADYLFDLKADGGVIGQICDMYCDFATLPDGSPAQPKEFRVARGPHEKRWEYGMQFPNHNFCSSVMLLEPSVATLQGLQHHANSKMADCIGDQEIIADYFYSKSPAKLRYFNSSAATWGRCRWAGVNTSIVHKQNSKGWPRGPKGVPDQ